MTQPLIVQATALAYEWHVERKQQVRKASLVPDVSYFCHLLQVAGMVQEAGGSDEMVAAALLHDVLEDTDFTELQLRAVMPDAVVSLVLECTEIGTSGPVKASWQQRKDAYIEHLAEAGKAALLISIADKLHSLRSLKQCVRTQGLAAYENLVTSVPTLEERRRLTLWFNSQICLVAFGRLHHVPEEHGTWPLLDDLGETLRWLEIH